MTKSKMTKKNYDLIAASVRRSSFIPDKNKIRQQARESMRRLIANDLAGSLYGEDPRFDRDKFLQACGIETSSVLSENELETQLSQDYRG